ncbi:alpha/beta fold hydrolase [Roseibium aestuarii]|nr:alpha/beta fold hydrolase [Roseibium aestuarii]
MEHYMERMTIEAEGALLAARLYRPVGPLRAHQVLHGATGVPQLYYRPFAEWAASRGVATLTYDYRDFGESGTGPLRRSRATFIDWMLSDQQAAEQALARLAPEGSLRIIGHSLGGLGFSFRVPDPRVDCITTVGAGVGHVSDHPWSYRPLALAFWYLLGPVGIALTGYLPGRHLALGADLPKGVYWQWRRWCTRHGFYSHDFGSLLPHPDYERVTPALRVLTMADDPVVPPAACRRYADCFPAERVAYRILDPQAHGLRRLGHIQVFSRASAPVWPELLGLGEEAGPSATMPASTPATPSTASVLTGALEPTA